MVDEIDSEVFDSDDDGLVNKQIVKVVDKCLVVDIDLIVFVWLNV